MIPEHIVQTIFAFADYFTCKICYTRCINIAIVPCGHTLCHQCLNLL